MALKQKLSRWIKSSYSSLTLGVFLRYVWNFKAFKKMCIYICIQYSMIGSISFLAAFKLKTSYYIKNTYVKMVITLKHFDTFVYLDVYSIKATISTFRIIICHNIYHAPHIVLIYNHLNLLQFIHNKFQPIQLKHTIHHST